MAPSRRSTSGMSAGSRRSHSGANPTPVTENAQKLASLISAKSIKHMLGEVSVGMGKLAPDKKQKEPEKDPDQLIHEFDDKLAEIQAMLNAYKEEVAHEEEAMAAHARAHTRGRGPLAGQLAAREEQRKKERVITEAEAYMNEKIQRRVQSAGPGASRALSEKVANYRTNPLARAELTERCRQHEKWKEEREARIRAARAGTFDFIKSNQVSLRDDPQPYLSRVMSVAQSWACQSTRPSTAPVGTWPSPSPTRPVTAPTGPGTEGGAIQQQGSSIISGGGTGLRPRPSKGAASTASGAGGAAGAGVAAVRSRRSTVFGESNAAVHFSGSGAPPAGPLSALGNFNSYFLPSAPLGSGATSGSGAAGGGARGAWASPAREGGAASARGSPNRMHTRRGSDAMSMSMSASTSFAPGPRRTSPPGIRNPSRSVSPSSRPCSVLSIHRTHIPTLAPRSGDAEHPTVNFVDGGDGTCFGAGGWGNEDGEEEEDGEEQVGLDPWTGVLLGTRSPSPEAIAVERELRISVTSRPASGGSPTRLQDYVATRRVLAARQREHEKEVKARRLEIESYRRHKKEIEAEVRARREQEEVRARAEQQAALELMERHRAWLGITTLAHKLVFLRQCVGLDREVRPLRAVRREAAVYIATWYKHVLLRRRQRELTELVLRLRRTLQPHITRKKEEVRQRCADRIVHFLQHSQQGTTESAVAAIRGFKDKLLFIQAEWRTMVMVRRTQRAVLYQYFTRFERGVVKRNQQEGRAAEAAVRQRLPARAGGGLSRKSVTTTSMATSVFTSHAARGGLLHGDEDGLGASITSLPGAGAGARPGSPDHQLRGAGKRMMAEIEDPVLEAEIAAHREMLPREIRHKVVEEAVLDIRRKFYKQLAGYRAQLEVYEAQRPIEELRLRLLSEAGLDAVPQLRKPVQPRMHVLLPRPALKRLLQAGMRALEEHKAAVAIARRKLAEKLWQERQAAKAAAGEGGAASEGTEGLPDPETLEQLLKEEMGGGEAGGGGGFGAGFKSRPISAKSYKSMAGLSVGGGGPLSPGSRHHSRSPTRANTHKSLKGKW